VADLTIVPHLMAAAFLGFPLDAAKQPVLTRWMERLQERPAVARDNADVVETLQPLQAEGRPAFAPYRVQWRSDRLEWVIKSGFADWFADEMRGRGPSSPSRLLTERRSRGSDTRSARDASEVLKLWKCEAGGSGSLAT